MSIGQIHGLKFDDLDGDGAYQPGEPGLGNWTIELIDAETGEVVDTQLTSPIDGRYWFENVHTGTYLVREVQQAGWTQTTPDPPEFFVDGNVVTTLDKNELAFGNYPSTTDYGDAPAEFGQSGYPTLLSADGARHEVSTLFLGTGIDPDVDGQTSDLADGDDQDPDGDDEDGVQFLDPLVPGTKARVSITVSEDGVLDAWADFNRDGDWADTFEQIFTNEPVTAGTENLLEFPVPFAFSDFGETFLRFRLSSQGGLAPTGAAGDGEVEDYRAEIVAADFGDAPDVLSVSTDFPTLRASGGAGHAIPGAELPGDSPVLWLGGVDDRPDPDEDGQPNNVLSGGDDGDRIFGDDENGIVFVGAFGQGLVPGLVNQVQVTVTHLGKGAGKLNAWIDFNRDGDWADDGEQVFDDLSLEDPTGFGTAYTLDLFVPRDAEPGLSHSRFRFSTEGGLSFEGLAMDGEVEDHEVTIDLPLDFGDAPDDPVNPLDFPTTLAEDGARHVIVDGVYLGHLVDPEPDGQPNETATGDDYDLGLYPSLGDDEDAVRFLTLLIPGTVAELEVKASVDGYLDAWVDFSGDQDWDDTGEHLFDGLPTSLSAGFNSLTFPVPAGASFGVAYARFRFTTQPGGLEDHGLAPDGEVEDYLVTIERADFGDAPPPYPTTIADNGAAHAVDSNDLMLGTIRDSEQDGLPDNNALGDDGAGDPDDEDGVVFASSLLPGTMDEVTVEVSGAESGAYLDAWIDFNGDGDWLDDGEQIIRSDPIIEGPNVYTGSKSFDLVVPEAAVAGRTFARFRLSSQGGLAPNGLAFDGEVEDYKIEIGRLLDFGDAPDDPDNPLDFPTTLAKDGARHVMVEGIHLGDSIDIEPDGQPTNGADGDGDDEDGVRFLTPLIPGTLAKLEVEASVEGYLDAWVDFSGDQSWDDPGEHVFAGEPLLAGTNPLTFPVPAGVNFGETYARFRFTTQPGGLEDHGLAPDGEVEDYLVAIERADFGDAPPPYPTTIADNGAAHAVDPDNLLILGTYRDSEQDGLPDNNALGDDLAAIDDEDGVVFTFLHVPGMLLPGTADEVTVTVSGAESGAYLDAWIDFNADGDWLDDGEHIITSDPIIADPNVDNGDNLLPIVVPETAVAGCTFARFRLSSQGGLTPDGLAFDGEVEDYKVCIDVPLDFGDAPEDGEPGDFPTALKNPSGLIGPSHVVVNGVYLGSGIDPEVDGQPSNNADGDDLAGADDEDGVEWATPVVRGRETQIEVTASVAGFLNAWMDFNGDHVWNLSERIFLDEPLIAGVNTLSVDIPDGATLGSAIARFRFTTTDPEGTLDFHDGTPDAPTGPAADGEVEDYEVTIFEGDYGDAPDRGEGTLTYPTLSDPGSPATDGAVHAIAPSLEAPNLILGTLVDGEPDGQLDPRNLATGDDISDFDDEDGVTLLSQLMPGTSATIAIDVNGTLASGFLDAWIDFNANGNWNDLGEQVFAAHEVLKGNTVLEFSVPADAVPGWTFARFRLSSQGGLAPTGPALDGEVEDYRVEIVVPRDYGDALDDPDNPLDYPTYSASNGAYHVIVPGAPSLGGAPDAELDGQPTSDANGDDGDAEGDDEDGVDQLTPFIQGANATLRIEASAGGASLNAWIDFNGDGDWDDPGEQVAADVLLNAGDNDVSFDVPYSPVFLLPLDVVGRFRLSTEQGLSYLGPASDGEVEDHRFTIYAADYGDAPDNPTDPTKNYPTLESNDGAAHALRFWGESLLRLGDAIDGESDGQPDNLAAGDDFDSLFPPNDEDGVTFDSSWRRGEDAEVTVNVQGDDSAGTPYLDVWVDFNGDGDWEPNEKVHEGSVDFGDNAVSIHVPADAVSGQTFARFRLSSEGGLDFSGPAFDGEVEDYLVEIADPPPCWQNQDNPLDVDADGDVDVEDLLPIVENLQAHGPHQLPCPLVEPPPPPPPYYDVDGDNWKTRRDMLAVQNYLEEGAKIRFSDPESVAYEPDGPHPVEILLNLPGDVTLKAEWTYRVVDLGTGSAKAGEDYEFDDTEGTFPADAGRSTQPVSIIIVDDDLPESNETIELGLQVRVNNVPLWGEDFWLDVPADRGGRHVVTILDDDSSLLLASEAVLPTSNVEPVSDNQLTAVVDAAVAQWELAGLDSERLDVLRGVEFRISPLAGARLAETQGCQVTVDPDAAGHGWFVDPTPTENEEFLRTEDRLQAIDASLASDRMDLLTVVSHELGHVLGLADVDPARHPSSLMAGTLAPGQRRLAIIDLLMTSELDRAHDP